MRKRWLCLVLAVVFMLAMTGCGNASDEGTQQEGADASQTEQQEAQALAGNPNYGLQTWYYRVKSDYQGQWDDYYNMQTVDCEY